MERIAREQLLDCIERHPAHPGATVLLSAIAVLDEDQDILDVVTADLESLRIRDGAPLKERTQIADLLTTIAASNPSSHGEGDTNIDERQLEQAALSVMLAPSQPFGWNQLAAISSDTEVAESAVLTALKAAPPSGSLEAGNLATAFAGTGTLADAQRAIMYSPSRADGWSGLVL